MSNEVIARGAQGSKPEGADMKAPLIYTAGVPKEKRDDIVCFNGKGVET